MKQYEEVELLSTPAVVCSRSGQFAWRCSSVSICGCYNCATFRTHGGINQVQNLTPVSYLGLKIEVCLGAARRNVPEDLNLQQYSCQIIKYCIVQSNPPPLKITGDFPWDVSDINKEMNTSLNTASSLDDSVCLSVCLSN
jgi:hypothetical protein